jgi:hypothetical protein
MATSDWCSCSCSRMATSPHRSPTPPPGTATPTRGGGGAGADPEAGCRRRYGSRRRAIAAEGGGPGGNYPRELIRSERKDGCGGQGYGSCWRLGGQFFPFLLSYKSHYFSQLELETESYKNTTKEQIYIHYNKLRVVARLFFFLG